MTQGKRPERRKHARVSKKTPVVVLSSDFEGIYLESEDMSLGGICLRLDEPYQEGTEICLQFHLPNRGFPIEVMGVVTSVRGENEFGVEFIEVDPGVRQDILKYMADRKK